MREILIAYERLFFSPSLTFCEPPPRFFNKKRVVMTMDESVSAAVVSAACGE